MSQCCYRQNKTVHAGLDCHCVVSSEVDVSTPLGAPRAGTKLRPGRRLAFASTQAATSNICFFACVGIPLLDELNRIVTRSRDRDGPGEQVTPCHLFVIRRLAAPLPAQS